ncbi:MAG: GNAT family N-acetyltransferase [Burkholderiales bacterium]|jgi:RimJ/RimL family protein N-acetyltransferase
MEEPVVGELKASVEIQSARLMLRRFTFADAAFFVELLNDPDWIRFIGDRGVRTEDDARAYMAKTYIAQYERLGYGLYLVQAAVDSTPIGMCGLIKREGLDDVDIGFAFLPIFRGQGYALEAATATLQYGRDVLKLKRVVAIATPDNLSSIALMKKIGMKFERATRLHDDAEELVVYAIEF